MVNIHRPDNGSDGLRRPRSSPKIDAAPAQRHRLRMLLAEDNGVNQKLALRPLQQMGGRADLAPSGIEAIECIDYRTKPIRVDELAEALNNVPAHRKA